MDYTGYHERINIKDVEAGHNDGMASAQRGYRKTARHRKESINCKKAEFSVEKAA